MLKISSSFDSGAIEVVRLDDPVDVVAYVRRLESMLIEVLAEFGIPGTRVEGRSGVWLTGPGRAAVSST